MYSHLDVYVKCKYVTDRAALILDFTDTSSSYQVLLLSDIIHKYTSTNTDT